MYYRFPAEHERVKCHGGVAATVWGNVSMLEKDTWAIVRPFLTHLDPQRIEDRSKLGVPDVNCAAGWIELKHLSEWPKRDDTVIRLPHFTAPQRAWLTRRCRINRIMNRPFGSWFLLHISSADEFLFYPGDVAAAAAGKITREQLRAAAVLKMTRATLGELTRFLDANRP